MEPYAIEEEANLNLTGLLKLYNVRFETEGTSVFERLTDYIGLQHKILGKKVFILLGIKAFFDQALINELLKFVQYEHISLLLVDYCLLFKLPEERLTVIDKDLCIIES